MIVAKLDWKFKKTRLIELDKTVLSYLCWNRSLARSCLLGVREQLRRSKGVYGNVSCHFLGGCARRTLLYFPLGEGDR